MNIGITCYPTYGGSGAVATELGIELARAGHSVHFISYDLPFKLDRFNKNIFFHEVEMLEYSLFKYPPYSLSLSAKMVEIIESENIDILHVHYAIPHATSAYLAKEIVNNSKIKFVTTLHGTDITLVGTHGSFYRITKFSIEKSDGITCVSNYLKETTANTFNIRKDIEVIYNFVDTERYKRVEGSRMDLDFLGKDDKVIIHISNFRRVKNIDKIIKVFRSVSREVRSKLILVGDGPDTCNIRNMVNKLDLKDKVIFMGIQKNIIPLLNISDLYMLPSKSEGFGLSALEALSCEVPVIGTSIGGLKEVVEHGKSGFIIDPEDTDSMIKSAVNILSSNDVRINMGKEARKRAELFDKRLIVPKYLKYYEKVLNST